MRKFQQIKTRRGQILAGVLAAGVAGGALTSGLVGQTGAVLADPVTVEAPQQTFGFADVVEKVSPAVVSVRVNQEVASAGPSGGPGDFMSPFGNLPEDHPLRRFFDTPNGPFGQGPGFPTPRQDRAPRSVMGQGSGFFISADGYLVTNNHVVQNGTNYTIVLDDGTEFSAELIGTDARTDLALLKVDAQDREFTYVEFGNDEDVRIGEWVVAVGNPFGLGGSVTAGIVSARGRDIGAGPYDDFLQIDAAVNRGNSGGPAFDLQGKVIGVNTAIFSPSGGNVGIAFAIPANVARDVVQALREKGEVERGWLGVQIGPVSEDIAEAVGLDSASGAIVTLPEDETPAKAAGIETGDVIVKVNNQKIEDPRTLSRMIANFAPGTQIDVTVWRDGEEQTLDVTLGDLSSLDQELAGTPSSPGGGMNTDPSALSGYGLTVTPSEEGEGVVVTNVDPESAAAERGVEAGDVIVAINGQSVQNQDEVREALEAAAERGRKAALFQVQRGDQNRFVALPIAES